MHLIWHLLSLPIRGILELVFGTIGGLVDLIILILMAIIVIVIVGTFFPNSRISAWIDRKLALRKHGEDG